MSNAKETPKTHFLLNFLLSDNSEVIGVTTAKGKQTLQIHTLRILFVYPGNICVVTVTSVNSNIRLKYKVFGLYFR